MLARAGIAGHEYHNFTRLNPDSKVHGANRELVFFSSLRERDFEYIMFCVRYI